jgi:hypothetical protein
MVLGNIERVEVVEVSFDLAIVFDGITESDEDVFQTLAQQGDRMAMTGTRTPAWLRNIDAFAGGARSFDVV